MNSGRIFTALGKVIAVYFALLLALPADAETKYIHLRNELIATEHLDNSAVNAKTVSANGLFLVQFEGHVRAAWRTALQTNGADVVKYVPDDSFIVRITNGAVAQIRALSFVRWVGPYRPGHKVHPRLSARTNAATTVNIMLSPRATAAEIKQVEAMLSGTESESHLRQGVIVRGTLPKNLTQQLAQLDSVLWIEPAPHRKLVDELASKIVGGDDGLTGTPTVTEQLHFGGSNVTVCVSDTGLDTGNTNTMHPDVRGRITGFQYYGSLTDGSDGYGHGTHCAGIVAGNAATGETDPATGAWYGLGVASQANLFIERIFDANANEVTPTPSDATLARDAVRNGAQIFSASWGNDVQGEYDTDAAQFDELVRDADSATPGDQPFIMEFSAGNAGPDSQTLDSPATGKNVIATGASETVSGTESQTYGLYDDGPDTMADFSSRGPCEDGRIKPDLVAPGTWIASMASSAALDEGSIAWATIDNFYVYMGGTSMSGPFASGAAADFVQYYRSTHTNAAPSPALVKAALINSAAELDENNGGPGPIPNNDEGWGRITLTNIIGTSRAYQYVDQTVLLSTGQEYDQHVFVQDPTQPLKITLAYTDVPGFPGAVPALVNNLDLVVVGPDGTVYRGNQFTDGESTPNATGADAINNVEGVQLSQPAPGNYLVRIIASNVPEDARLDTATIDQDFALVLSGSLVAGPHGEVIFDRTNYTAPGAIHLQVLDAGRAGGGTVSVLVKSATETAGEDVTLSAVSNYGAFSGAIATLVGNAVPDGILEIHNGDTIEADYTDSSGTVQKAFATANLIPPVISAIATNTDIGVLTITWQTSEASDSVVYYGTNSAALNLVASDPTLTTSHSLILANLVAGATYYFAISSTDEAGNSATNNNSGNSYSFVAGPTPTVLLVDAYETADGSPVIDDGSYTNAIAAAGFSFAHWKVLDRGSPQLVDLKPFKIVMWRTTDDIINYTGTNNTLTPQQQAMIETYLNGGGSFFMSSMGILSQLGDVPFRQSVLQVGGFVQNPDPPAACSCDEYFGVPAIEGAPTSPITSGMNITLDYSSYPSVDFGDGLDFGPDFGDTFTPVSTATPITFEIVSGKACGASYPPIGVDSPGRIVFLSFPIDVVPFSGPTPDNEVTLLQNALNFLDPGANGVGTIHFDNSVYTVPDTITVEVGDSDLAGTGQTQITIRSSSSPFITINLAETSHPGLFRGFVTLVSSNTSVAGQLFAQNGDIIRARYFDVSAQTYVITTATVQTVPPVISQVQAATNIGSAVVTWNTSTPSDSAVIYGVRLLDQSVYDSQLVTNHAITLSGLLANRTYFFKVVSRDEAGNTATDDNNGALYSFVTPKTLQPPWFDNLESGAIGWSVVPDNTSGLGSSLNWTIGTPNNGLQTNAYSGTHCWGSDLNGEPIPFSASSYLYGPFIDLTGAGQVTLTFWDCFDFSQVFSDPYYYEQGQILISTNPATDPGSLPFVADFSGLVSDGWEQETVDLSAYAGQTVQVVWDYLAFDGGSHYGWLVDDVSITNTAAGQGGTIVVTKNIGAGSFNLTGPISQSGLALSTTLSNAPPGQYSVQFGDVAFFVTTPGQTNTLTAGGTLAFNGNYTFPDVNNNGISDLFEQYYFGTISTNRTRSTDTDGDGMSDYAEFIAGTDPTNAASNLRFVKAFASGGQVTLQWSAVPGRLYQVQSSTNLSVWTAVSDWDQALVSPLTFVVTNASSGSSEYRIQVRP